MSGAGDGVPSGAAPPPPPGQVRLYEILPEPASRIDAGFRVLDQNRAARETYGPAGERRCHEIFFGRDLPCPGCLLGEALKHDRVERFFLARGEPGAPGTSYFEVTAIPLHGPEGTPAAIVEILRDVTATLGVEHHLMRDAETLASRIADLQEHLDELTASRSAVLQTEKMATIGRLAAGIAHEVHTPLGTIVANVDMLTRRVEQLAEIAQAPAEPAPNDVGGGLAAQLRADLPALVDMLALNSLAVERIQRIVRSLKLFAHLDRAEFERVDPHQGIEAALALLAHETRGRIQVERDFAEVPPVVCRPDAMNQVYMNLIHNAIQAIEGPGTIRIATRHEPATADAAEAVTIAIHDSGKGIPPEARERVFDAGFTTKPRGVGTGLGLAVVRRTVADHGGTVGFTSQPGRTVFTVRLPVSGPDPDRRHP